MSIFTFTLFNTRRGKKGWEAGIMGQEDRKEERGSNVGRKERAKEREDKRKKRI